MKQGPDDFNSINYLDRGRRLVSWSPDWFDIDDAWMMVTKALNSPTSTPGKQYVALVPDQIWDSGWRRGKPL